MIGQPQIVTDELITRAINSGIRLGEVFEVLLDDGRVDMIGRRPTDEFIDEWRSCFKGSRRKPRKNRAYLGIVYGDGAYLVEI
jgi:hypothetical protein